MKQDDVSNQEFASSEAAATPVVENAEKNKRNGRRGIYLLPNLFTTAALFSGFYAIVASMNADFEKAAIAIFIAMVLDGLDGRVARMTNTQSDFGAEYDSLADMVSFGMAPALVGFNWALHDLGKIGWVAAFIYVACAALRLARFNTQLAVADKNFFTGLASPSAAAIVAGAVWVLTESGIEGQSVAMGMALLITIAGLLMVSNLRYHSFKSLDFKGRIPFVALLAIVLIFVVVSIDPAKVLLAVFALYGASGPVFWLRRQIRLKYR